MTTPAEDSRADTLPLTSGAASLIDGHYTPPPEDRDAKTWIRTSVIIQAHPRTLYEMWRDVEAAPKWHEKIVEVRRTGPTTYRWVMRDEPNDNVLEWDFEILADEPERRIAWRSVSGDPKSAGEVIFEPAPGGRGTMVTVLEQFRIGALRRAWETITSRDPKQSLIENLRHFKALAETGEIPRAEPQPHGKRGISASLKRSAYGETIETPPGDSAVAKSPAQKGSR